MLAAEDSVAQISMLLTKLYAACVAAAAVAGGYNLFIVSQMPARPGIPSGAWIGPWHFVPLAVLVLLAALIWRGKVWAMWVLPILFACSAAVAAIWRPGKATVSDRFLSSLDMGMVMFAVLALVLGAIAYLAGRTRS
jgi:hypothetical protein